MMNIDEAIKYAEDLGTEEENKIDYDKDSPHMIICRKNTVKDYRQLAEWLTELKEAKRLLKAAFEDIVWLNEHTVDGEGQCLIETATDMETCLACPLNVNNPHVCGWKHQAEALALIGEDGDTNG